MTPAQHVRIILTEYKGLGVPFSMAWASAMRSLPRNTEDLGEWREQLQWARPAFQAAYENRAFYCEVLTRTRTRLRYGARSNARCAPLDEQTTDRTSDPVGDAQTSAQRVAA